MAAKKFSLSVEINKPAEEVVNLYMNKNNYQYWNKDFISYEKISGNDGEPGSVTKLVFKKVTLIETVTHNDLPREIKKRSDHKAGEKTVMTDNTVTRFIVLPNNKTRIETELELTEVFGFLPKLLVAVMGGAVKKYHQKQLDNFKIFADKSS